MYGDKVPKCKLSTQRTFENLYLPKKEERKGVRDGWVVWVSLGMGGMCVSGIVQSSAQCYIYKYFVD